MKALSYKMYTVGHKKTRHVYICDNSGKYWPIFVKKAGYVNKPCTDFNSIPSWLNMVERLDQHSIGYTGDGLYRSEDSTNSIKVLHE